MEQEKVVMEKKAYRLPELMDMFGVSKPSIYRWIKNNEFPRPIKIGKTSLWPTDDIDSWWHDQQLVEA